MKWKQNKKNAAVLNAESGYIKKVWGTRYSVCLAYPHYYRTGMSNLGFQTVYKIFNEQPSFLCERVFLPAVGDEAEFAAGRAEISSMESQKPVAEFDILAFSISFENDYPHILKMLKLADIPFLARHRRVEHPLIMAGGIAVTMNPEPLADFFDLFILGEAEQVLSEFSRLFQEASEQGIDRKEMLRKMQKKLPQIYVPELYKVQYGFDGKIAKVEAADAGLPKRIKILPPPDLNSFDTKEVVSSPHTEMAEMYLVEVNRGCARHCRFCAASFIYRPARFRAHSCIVKAIDRGLQKKRKIGLIGTAVSDHPRLTELCSYILQQKAQVGIGSLRADQINDEIVLLLKASGVETVALAPEAGSQRLRDMLRKEITEEEIINAAWCLAENEIPNLRLYFMVGLPTEKEEDVDAVVGLTKKIRHYIAQRSSGTRKFQRLTLSVNQFIPKPATPLQWCALEDVNVVAKKIRKIAQSFSRERQIKVIHDVPKWNYIQALLSLGDRRVGEILLAACRLRDNWAQAIKEVNVNADFYVYRQKSFDEILPWDIVQLGTSKNSLVRECQKALAGDP